MNLPNKLTLGRLIITVVFVVASAFGNYSLALLLFILASLTDYFDGYLARKYNLITSFGKLMDPLADKVLLCSAFVILTENPNIKFPAWVTIAVLTREFLVTGLRLLASSQGKVMAADTLGKHKTAWQIGTAVYYLLFLAAKEPALQCVRGLYEFSVGGVRVFDQPCLGYIGIGMTLLTTLVSGWLYFWKNRALVLKEM